MRRVRDLQQGAELRGTGAQRDVVKEPAHVLDGLHSRDARTRGQGRDLERAEGPAGDVGQGAARVGQNDVYVGARAQGASDDEVDGGAGRVLRVVHDGLREEAANEARLDSGHVGRVHVYEGLVGLEARPDRLEGRVSGELAVVVGVDADTAAELLLDVQEVELREDALDIVPVREDAEEAEFAGVWARRGGGEVAEVGVEVAGELAACFACAGYGDAGGGN